MKFSTGDKIENDSGFGPEQGEIVDLNNLSYIIRWEGNVITNKYTHYIIDTNYVYQKQFHRDMKLRTLLNQ